MMRKAMLAVAAFATLVFTTPATAQSICGERSRFVEQLRERYSESLTAIGLASNGTLLEILTAESGSWTVMITRPDGVSCVIASGEAWETLPRVAMGPAA